MQTPVYHIPAFRHNAVELLVNNPEGIYVDATFGGGGHSSEILKKLHTSHNKKRLFSFDKDIEASSNQIDDERWQFVHSDFTYLKTFLNYYGVTEIDGLIADLGVSFHHFDSEYRGFSFRFDSPLDMRMNQKGGKTAADIIAQYDKDALTRIFTNYGEVKNAHLYASLIVKARQSQPITTTFQLIEALSPNAYYASSNVGIMSPSFKHTLTCLFQAIRIEVNDEMMALKTLLADTLSILKPSGRIVVISYHSLEDRMVKNFFRYGTFDCQAEKDFYGRIITPFRIIKCPLCPTEEEIQTNPRARSAKMRVVERL